jgi:hypothetical protein
MKSLNAYATISFGLLALTATSCNNMDGNSRSGNQPISTGTHQMGPPGRSQPMADSAMPNYAEKQNRQQR